MHLHHFNFEVNACQAHKHRASGYADSMLGIEKLHFHYYCGVTSYNSHTHYYSGFTSLPIQTENGHIHKMEGLLDVNTLHEHPYNAYTYEEIQYTGKTAKTALGSY